MDKKKNKGSWVISEDQFVSAPWCFNGHTHTILCSKLFTNPHMEFNRIRIDTPDGDFLDLDTAFNSSFSSTAVLLHGLEGSSSRYYIRRLAHRLHQSGFNIVAMNFRSCSGVMNKNPRFYHSGETRDLELVLNWAQSQFKNNNLFTAGFSLGASAMLNYIEKNPENPVDAFAAISTPFDLYRGSLNLQKGFNKVYNLYFMSSLTKKLKEKRKLHSDLPDFKGKTLFEFDDKVTAPLHGFEDAEDYYRKCSSAFFMDRIQTNGLIIHSKEDPLCPFEYTPVNEIKANPNLVTLFPERGGHVGFWSLPPGWVENSITQYFTQFITD